MLNIASNLSLLENWKIQSAKNISFSGELISKNPKISKDWIAAKIPSTVLGTLVSNNVFTNSFFSENLKKIPSELFEVPWWYATSFFLDKKQAENFVLLKFDGINYKANVWLNGQLIADTNSIDGAYRITSFDISKDIVKGINILAVEVIPPKPGDFSTGFVDWNPAPPDGNMGIFRTVSLHLHRGVHILNPFVQTKVNLQNLKEAKFSISAELTNFSNKTIAGQLVGKIENNIFKQDVVIEANTKKIISFSPSDFPQLIIKNPRLWWPIHFGEANLYHLELQFIENNNNIISDTVYQKFGIREVEDYWLNDIHRGFKINGQKILIKGAGWTDDLFLMDTDESLEAQVKYVKQMNLNCIRLEGFWGKSQKLYDLCDEHGILLMVGWSCHWEHELHFGVPVHERFGGVYTPQHIEHVAKAWEEQVIYLRNHPSIFVWAVASDKVPITALEEKYIQSFEKYDPTRPYLNSTGGVGSEQHVIGSEDVVSEISGSSGVKMLGPYAYTAPIYWFTDKKFGGAYGFNTETGPGAQVPQIESLKKILPKNKYWPINEVWDYHCGRYEFSDLTRFTSAINERYGAPSSLEEFDKKAQAMNYELMRPMFEAFQVYKKRSTGIIQWMLNSAWPKMYWQLYDYYLNPTAAFYATQKACAPLSLIYNYGNKQIYAINDFLNPVRHLHAIIRIFDIHSTMILRKDISFDMDADTSLSIFEIPELENISPSYFIDLRLLDKLKKEVYNNFYWLSTKEEILDYEADLGEFAFHTPSKEYADFKLLNNLPTTSINFEYHFEKTATEQKIIVQLENLNNTIAFLINLKLFEKDTNELILPIFWEDNFISLLAGEKRTITASYQSDQAAFLKLEGWNS